MVSAWENSLENARYSESIRKAGFWPPAPPNNTGDFSFPNRRSVRRTLGSPASRSQPSGPLLHFDQQALKIRPVPQRREGLLVAQLLRIGQALADRDPQQLHGVLAVGLGEGRALGFRQ